VSSDPPPSPSNAASSDPQDREHSPKRHLITSIILWAWIVFWLFGLVVYVVSLVQTTLSPGLASFGIGLALAAELVALFVGDVWHVRTRWRLQRRTGHRPSGADVRGELWRARDARRHALAKVDNTLHRAGKVMTEGTVGTGSQMLRAGKGVASTVGDSIDQVREGRSDDKVRRVEEVGELSARAVDQALQRYKDQRPGVTADDTEIQFRSYATQAAYRDDSLGLVAAGWYEQANPTLRYTIPRDGFLVIMWRRSPWHRQTG
jgi:hypothetical protein